MASTKEYLDFVMEQLSGLDELNSRAMMGAYILYYRGRIFGGIYDDRLLVKPVPMALRLMPDAEMELPYNGAKEMILVDGVYESPAEAGADGEYSGGLACEITICVFTIMERYK